MFFLYFDCISLPCIMKLWNSHEMQRPIYHIATIKISVHAQNMMLNILPDRFPSLFLIVSRMNYSRFGALDFNIHRSIPFYCIKRSFFEDNKSSFKYSNYPKNWMWWMIFGIVAMLREHNQTNWLFFFGGYAMNFQNKQVQWKTVPYILMNSSRFTSEPNESKIKLTKYKKKQEATFRPSERVRAVCR